MTRKNVTIDRVRQSWLALEALELHLRGCNTTEAVEACLEAQQEYIETCGKTTRITIDSSLLRADTDTIVNDSAGEPKPYDCPTCDTRIDLNNCKRKYANGTKYVCSHCDFRIFPEGAEA